MGLEGRFKSRWPLPMQWGSRTENKNQPCVLKQTPRFSVYIFISFISWRKWLFLDKLSKASSFKQTNYILAAWKWRFWTSFSFAPGGTAFNDYVIIALTNRHGLGQYSHQGRLVLASKCGDQRVTDQERSVIKSYIIRRLFLFLSYGYDRNNDMEPNSNKKRCMKHHYVLPYLGKQWRCMRQSLWRVKSLSCVN